MARSTVTITVSLPPEMLSKIDMKKEGRTRSELVREALRRYFEEREWKEIIRYGMRVARERGITEDQVEETVDEYRWYPHRSPRICEGFPPSPPFISPSQRERKRSLGTGVDTTPTPYARIAISRVYPLVPSRPLFRGARQADLAAYPASDASVRVELDFKEAHLVQPSHQPDRGTAQPASRPRGQTLGLIRFQPDKLLKRADRTQPRAESSAEDQRQQEHEAQQVGESPPTEEDERGDGGNSYDLADPPMDPHLRRIPSHQVTTVMPKSWQKERSCLA